MKKRVIYWTQLFRPYIGGVEVHASQLLPRLSKKGYEFTVITSHGCLDLPDEDVYDGISVHRFRFREALEKRDITQILSIKKKLNRIKQIIKPDIVHIQFTDPSIFFHLHTKSAYPALTIVSVRVALPDKQITKNSLLERTLDSASWVTANSEAILHDLRHLKPDLVNRSSIIYEGFPRPM